MITADHRFGRGVPRRWCLVSCRYHASDHATSRRRERSTLRSPTLCSPQVSSTVCHPVSIFIPSSRIALVHTPPSPDLSNISLSRETIILTRTIAGTIRPTEWAVQILVLGTNPRSQARCFLRPRGRDNRAGHWHLETLCSSPPLASLELPLSGPTELAYPSSHVT